jgi:hypothetical protein
MPPCSYSCAHVFPTFISCAKTCANLHGHGAHRLPNLHRQARVLAGAVIGHRGFRKNLRKLRRVGLQTPPYEGCNESTVSRNRTVVDQIRIRDPSSATLLRGDFDSGFRSLSHGERHFRFVANLVHPSPTPFRARVPNTWTRSSRMKAPVRAPGNPRCPHVASAHTEKSSGI